MFASLALTISCQSKEAPEPGKVDLTISPEIIEAGAAGGEWKVKATCSEKPYIVGQSDWCSVTASPVRDNSCELTVNVAANDSYEARSFQYSVVCGDLKKYLKVNQEAARETARQLRLRNLSGIIVVDFIDMESPADREELMEVLRLELKKDPVKTVLVDMTPLGLVEITRKKVRKTLKEQWENA